MELLGLPFEVQIADVDERSHPGERPPDLVARLSRAKAQAVAARHPQATVIGADTIVTLGRTISAEGEILGKPDGSYEAAEMLRRLRDRAHQVYSGVCVVSPAGETTPAGGRAPAGGGTEVAVVESTVWMRAYTDGEIAAYVASGSPLDKAGAYGIQDARFHPVARLRGCYASVMGLPLCHMARLLCQAGVLGSTTLPNVPVLCSAATGVACCGGDSVELTFES